MEQSLNKLVQNLQEEIIEKTKQDYSGMVVKHWMNPTNFGKIDNPDGYAQITGSCGDTMELFLKTKDKRIEDARFLTNGCGVSIACGNFITELIKGKTVEQVEQITANILLTNIGGLPTSDEHCAVLATNTLQLAIKNL